MIDDSEELKIRKLIGRRIQEARKKAGITAAAASRGVGVSRAAFAQWESGKTKPTPSNLKLVSQILGAATEWLAPNLGIVAVSHEPEGKLIDIKTLPASAARILAAACVGRKTEVWQLTTDLIAGAQYHPGEYLIVDLEQAPKSQDFVLAEQSRNPIFRMLVTPYLFALPVGKTIPSLTVDGNQVVIKGVVISHHSL